MNKAIISVSVLIALLLINFGASFHRQASEVNEEIKKTTQENSELTQEIKQKESLGRSAPLSMTRAFNALVNQMHMIEAYGGTSMELSFVTKGDKNSLDEYFTDSVFQNVKSLPVVLKINKYSDQTDTISVLDDVHQLESRTDFKVREITDEHDVLQVKGDLYGI